MAFFNRVGNILWQTVSKHNNNVMSVARPSIFQMIHRMSNSKVFVGGMARATNETSLREAFSAFGEVSEEPESASAAIAEMDQTELHGQKVSVCYAIDRSHGGGDSDGSEDDFCKLFVGGMAQATNDTNLREAFSAYGEVTEARVIMDRETGRSRGFGFVTFACCDSASDAIIAMDQWELHGRTVSVCNAYYRPQGGGGGFRGSGGYGGGSFRGGGGHDNADVDGPIDDIA